MKKYDIILPYITATAREVVSHTLETAKTRHIDPKKIVFLVGEYHCQLGHELFEIETADAIAQRFGSVALVAEGDFAFTDYEQVIQFNENIKHGIPWEKALYDENGKKRYQSDQSSLERFAGKSGLSVHQIDTACYHGFEDFWSEKCIGAYYSDTLKNLIQQDSYYQKVISQCDDFSKSNKGCFEAKSKSGVIIREITMAENFNDIVQYTELDVPQLVVVGSGHIIDEKYERQQTLLSHLLQKDMYVSSILLSLDKHNENEKMETWHEMRHALSDNQKNHLIEQYYINMPWRGRVSTSVHIDEGIEQLQLKQTF